MRQGLFISIEGPDGGGKSTQVRLLSEALRQRAVHVVAVREPGGTPLGERVRDIVLDRLELHVDPRAEVLLFCAARAQLVHDVVLPALASGNVVIADRFSDSTRVYQAIARDLDSRAVEDVLSFAAGGLTPDRTFLLDLPAGVGLERKLRAAFELNRLDRESMEYHSRVRSGFLGLAALEPDRWRTLDAGRPAEALAQEILNDTLSRLRRVRSG